MTELGLSPEQVARAVRRGDWCRLQRGWYQPSAGTSPLLVGLPASAPREGQAATRVEGAEQEGRGAFGLGVKFDQCPYRGESESARVNKDFWERGWLSVLGSSSSPLPAR